MTDKKKIISFPDNFEIKLSGIDTMRLHNHGQGIFIHFKVLEDLKSYRNSFLINKLLEKGSLDFQITDFMFNKAKGFHGPFKSSLLESDDYHKISENIFFKTLLEILDKNRINTPKIEQKRKNTFIEKVELISRAKTNYYLLKKELSVEPKKFEHEWSHALTEYYEFLLINNSGNNIFSLLLAYD